MDFNTKEVRRSGSRFQEIASSVTGVLTLISISASLTILTFLSVASTRAQWVADPVENLVVAHGLFPRISSDGVGGVFLTYQNSITYPSQIELRRVNRLGFQSFDVPTVIAGALPESRLAAMASDERNGVIIAYVDFEECPVACGEPPKSRVRVQRVDSSGNILWGAIGVRVNLTEANQFLPQANGIVSDGRGGCFVAWGDTSDTVRVQRIDSLGARLFSDSGIVVGPNGDTNLGLVADQKGGVIIGWSYQRFQRIDGLGEKLWSDTGVVIKGGSNLLVSDGRSGFLTASMNYVAYNNGDPYWQAKSQLVDSNGTQVWGPNGIVLADSLQNIVINPPLITLDVNADGGGTFSWTRRFGIDTLRGFVQRIRRDGSFIFPLEGLRTSLFDSSTSGVFKIVASLGDSKIFVMGDRRFGASVFAQRIDSVGLREWNQYDNIISRRQLGNRDAISDGAGGIILTGFDQSDFSIRMQQCSRNGQLADIISSAASSPSEMTLPTRFALDQNFPNPFNPSTTIEFSLAESGLYSIRLFDVVGRFTRTLIDGYYFAGSYRIQLDASNLPSGIYFYQLKSRTANLVRKLILIR